MQSFIFLLYFSALNTGTFDLYDMNSPVIVWSISGVTFLSIKYLLANWISASWTAST